MSTNNNLLTANILTEKGDIKLRLFQEKAPLTVANFIALAEGNHPFVAEKFKGKPFYNGQTFHRVVENFVIQGGDPTGTGAGGPGYRFDDEFHPELKHNKAGILSMANAGPNTNGSQFFITLDATPWLDGKHAVFGEVIEGMDVVKKIQQGDHIKIIEIERTGQAKEFNAPEILNKFWKEKEEKAKAKKDAINRQIKKLAEGFHQTEIGLHYKIIRSNPQGKKINTGDTVQVHYIGRLPDGTVFDNSYGRGKPFEFTVGSGQVIPGWDEGIALLREGEKAILVIPPDLAYGEAGAGGVIPPDTPIIFEVEIIKAKS